MTTEELEVVSLADVPAAMRQPRGHRQLALKALLPGQAIRVPVGERKVSAVRGPWTSGANHVLGRRAVRTRYVDGYLYIWLRGDRDA